MTASLQKNLFIAGLPGTGKTTLIVGLAEALKPSHPAGFYTREIREGGQRLGFELVGLDGRQSLLAHVDIKGPFRVGKYGVDLGGFESFLEAIPFFAPLSRFIIVDEIGKMECLSQRFRRLMKEILDSDKRLIATIALRGTGFIEETKARKDVRILEISKENRDRLSSEILKEITTGFR